MLKLMDKQFKKLLFKSAFCTMACDGRIDDTEIEEIRLMDKNTSYFGDIDLSDEVDILVKQFKKNGKQVINDLFSELRKTDLNPVQELLLLEVTFRIMAADTVIDENEIRFLHHLRGALDVYDEVIAQRFGKNNLLFDTDSSEDAKRIDFAHSDSGETIADIDFSGIDLKRK